jgi:hypothetical protein
MQKKAVEPVKFSAYGQSMPKTISSSNVKLKPVELKNLNDSVKQNFSIYKSSKNLYQNDLTNQHQSIEGSQMPSQADDTPMSPPSRNGNKKKSIKPARFDSFRR